MWQQVIQKLTTIRQLAGVSIWITNDQFEVSAVILKQSKGIVKIDKQFQDLTLEAFLPELAKMHIPVAIHIDGRGILHRSIEKEADLPDQDMLNLVLPNAKAKEFIIQVCNTIGHRYISVIRNDLMKTILDSFSEKKVDVLQIYLGPYVASRLTYAAEKPIQSLIVKGWSLEFNENELTKVQPQQQQALQSSMDLKGGEVLPAILQVSYATAINSFINKKDDDLFELPPDFQNLRTNWEQKSLFQRAVKFALAFVFIVLLINTLLFVRASTRNEALTYQVQTNEQTLQKLESLKEDNAQKRKFISETSWGDMPRAAFYADRLAASVPEKVWLTEINIHPIDEKLLKEDRKQLFINKLILIKGKSSSAIMVNDWIRSLSDSVWIDNITDQEYEYSAQEKTGMFSFRIYIK